MKKLALIFIALITLTTYKAQEDLSIEDYRFTTSAAKSGLMEVKLAELAFSRTTSPEIKLLSERVIKQHTKLNKEIKRLADRRGIYLLADLDQKQQKHYRKLAQKKSTDFDRAYAKHVVNVQNSAISKLEKQIKNGQDPELISWAANTLASFETQVEITREANEAITSKNKLEPYKY